MIKTSEILETINMVEKEHFDIRTITMGLSLFGCIRESAEKTATAVYDLICKRGENIVKVANELSLEYGVPIVNKRVSITPASLLTANFKGQEIILARALDKAAKEIEEFKTHQMTLIKEEAHKLRQKMQEDLNRQVDSLHTQIRETLADNFVVLAKKMMHELSSESAFCGSLSLFQKRLTTLSKTDIKKKRKLCLI